MKLNYLFHKKNIAKKNIKTIVLIHGLFGNLSNLGILATKLAIYYQIVQLDLRNHGKSPHTNSMHYLEMSQDILVLLDQLTINKFIVIGHSIGGKVAMFLCQLAPNRIIKAIILDIAPVNYVTYNINPVFIAINDVIKIGATTRHQANQIMQKNIQDKQIILFLLKSFYQGRWLFNIKVIKEYYSILSNWHNYFPWTGKILFIKGELSTYINKHYYTDIFQNFPKAQIIKVLQVGHWLHHEKPDIVLNIINDFLKN
ncbi:esterase ybfF [Blochmannia endosymbiont of Camponotus (Colobopsis) obliquus]|nr:esterase ybfF [Blochmannia endosymbiont of Camponotus (Colobopsis) obliquus]